MLREKIARADGGRVLSIIQYAICDGKARWTAGEGRSEADVEAHMAMPSNLELARNVLSMLDAEGMVIVPKEPTEAMIEAICEVRNVVPNTRWTDSTTEGVQAIERMFAERSYAAMLSAHKDSEHG